MVFDYVYIVQAITKFVQVGRVVKINYGQYVGKLATIVEILNDKRVLVDGPTSGVPRHVIPLRRLVLTKLSVKTTRGARTGIIKKAIEKAAVNQQYSSLIGAKKAARSAIRAKLTDFDRFKVMILRKRRSAILAHQVKALRKTGSKGAQQKGGKGKK